MKKVFALVFTTLIIAGGAAPTFAAATVHHPAHQYQSHCVFKDKSLCEVKSLSPTMDDNGDV